MPTGFNKWIHYAHHPGAHLEIDPRVLIARHIGWTKPAWIYKTTTWSTPEPDNFSIAVYHKTPAECLWLTNQVFIKYKNGWITAYHCDAENIMTWKRWMLQTIKPWASWNGKNIALRESHTLLTKDKRKNTSELTENDVLYSMNNYERLKERTEFPELIDSRVGEPTDLLRLYLETIK